MNDRNHELINTIASPTSSRDHPNHRPTLHLSPPQPASSSSSSSTSTSSSNSPLSASSDQKLATDNVHNNSNQRPHHLARRRSSTTITNSNSASTTPLTPLAINHISPSSDLYSTIINSASYETFLLPQESLPTIPLATTNYNSFNISSPSNIDRADSIHSSSSHSTHTHHTRNHSNQRSQESHHQNPHHHHQQQQQQQRRHHHQHQLSSSSFQKSTNSSGRPKVKTLPPWAKSHEDDDLLFQPSITPSSSFFNQSSHPSPSTRHNFQSNPQQQQSGPRSNLQQPSSSSSSSSSSVTPPSPSLLPPAFLPLSSSSHGSSNSDSKHSSASKLKRSSFSTATLVADSPARSQDDEWSKKKDPLNTKPRALSLLTSDHQIHAQPSLEQLSPLVDGILVDNGPNSGPSSTRRSIYRVMTTPSPVFQRFKPLITINGQKKRLTEDPPPTGSGSGALGGPNSGHDQEDPLGTEQAEAGGIGVEEARDLKPSLAPRYRNISSHQTPPDDRWWQFTLPTKYRRKVEEYLSRGGQGIGGVHPFDQQKQYHQHHYYYQQQQQPSQQRPDYSSSSPPTPPPPTMEMMEIDEDQRKILALLKHTPFPTGGHPNLPSSLGSTNDFIDFQQGYDRHFNNSSDFYRNSLYKEHDEALNGTYHPPTDFPLSAFSRKLSITPSQQLLHQSKLPNLEGDENSTSLPLPPDFEDRLTKSFTNSFANHTYNNNSRGNSHNFNGPNQNNYYQSRQHQTRLGSIISYFMHHPTAPLVCRLLNFILTVISLGICASIRKIEIHENLFNVLGCSTLFILVVAPLALIHNLFAIYCEYFGAPIGIWSVSWKMFHTLSELVFVSLWSAGLALSFDDHLKSPLNCATGGFSDSRTNLLPKHNNNPMVTPISSNDNVKNLSTDEILSRLRSMSINSGINNNQTSLRPREESITSSLLVDQLISNLNLGTSSSFISKTNNQLMIVNSSHPDRLVHLCQLQASLVSIIFLGLALYTLVLIVSLFRIFIKVSRKY